MTEIAELTGLSLDPEHEAATGGGLSFALGRLEELGLIEWSERVPTV
jgi:hypothetical protein